MEKISVIICTKNRHRSLFICLIAILRNTFKPFEIIVVDQSDSDATKKIVKLFKRQNVLYIKSAQKGLSYARNIGIMQSKSPIIAFTDDDCIADSQWLQNIYLGFQSYPQIIGMFGITKPFKLTGRKGYHCPCTFESSLSQTYIISKPKKHWENIGYGNNMAFLREAFVKYGYFKEYLGVGSIGKSAEDAEFALRLLIQKKQLLHNHTMVVCHNKWINSEQMNTDGLSYACGEIACYLQFAMQGHKFARQVVLENFYQIFVSDTKKLVKLFAKMNKTFPREFLWWMKRLLFRFYGVVVAVYFYNWNNK